ncbi:MAG: tyrosine-type recombinase/integrase [Akkermansia sp.]|nr:tyrosine-type recombinase/integrase [Akkermansia sp.]
MASLKNRKGTWYAVWWQDGKAINRTTKIKVATAKEKKLAQSVADAMEKTAKGAISLDAAMSALRESATLDGFARPLPSIEEYLTTYPFRGKDSHLSTCQRAVKKFLASLGLAKLRPLNELSSQQCRDWIESELSRVSYGSVTLARACLNGALNDAVKEGLISRNPMAAASVSRLAGDTQRSMKRKPFTREEMRIITTQFPSPFREMATLSFLTGGQRIGDICLLKWENVHLKEGIIHFRTLKTGEEITAVITPRLHALLQSLPRTSEYILPEAASGYIRSNGSMSSKFSMLVQSFGFDTNVKRGTGKNCRPFNCKTFHSIRHSVVSFLRCHPAMTPDLVRAIVGHESEEVERGYFTADIEQKRSGYSALESILAM